MRARWIRVCTLLAVASMVCGAPAAPPAPATSRAQEAPAELELGGALKLKLALIPVGSFVMGSDTGPEGEGPAHEVIISRAFYFGVYVITQAQAASLDPAFRPMNRWVWMQPPASDPGARVEEMPQLLTFGDALGLCKLLSLQTGQKVRLPTEAEWEYACGAGRRSLYFFGDNPRSLIEYDWCGSRLPGEHRRYHQVGQKKPSPWGLYDVYGLRQFVSDLYGEYPARKMVDPTGPDPSKVRDPDRWRMCRGGGPGCSDGDARTTRRSLAGPNEPIGYCLRVVVESPLVAQQRQSGVFRFASLGKCVYAGVPLPCAAATAVSTGRLQQFAIPVKLAAPGAPEGNDSRLATLKATGKDDLLKITYSRAEGQMGVMLTAERYRPEPGEDQPGAYVFVRQSTQELDNLERPAVVVRKYLQETTFVVPVQMIAGRLEPPAEMANTIDSLQAGQLVRIENLGNTLRSIRTYSVEAQSRPAGSPEELPRANAHSD